MVSLPNCRSSALNLERKRTSISATFNAEATLQHCHFQRGSGPSALPLSARRRVSTLLLSALGLTSVLRFSPLRRTSALSLSALRRVSALLLSARGVTSALRLSARRRTSRCHFQRGGVLSSDATFSARRCTSLLPLSEIASYLQGAGKHRCLPTHRDWISSSPGSKNPIAFHFHTLSLRPHWFVNIDARKFDFTNVNWGRSASTKRLAA